MSAFSSSSNAPSKVPTTTPQPTEDPSEEALQKQKKKGKWKGKGKGASANVNASNSVGVVPHTRRGPDNGKECNFCKRAGHVEAECYTKQNGLKCKHKVCSTTTAESLQANIQPRLGNYHKDPAALSPCHQERNTWQRHYEASYLALADTLTLTVRLPLVRRESQSCDLYKPTFFPIMHGSHLYDIRTEEKIFAWEKATSSYLKLDKRLDTNIPYPSI
jgi:hypothetical protein